MMEGIDIGAIIEGMPNFVGLMVCIAVLYRLNVSKQTTIDRLIDTIVKRENCE